MPPLCQAQGTASLHPKTVLKKAVFGYPFDFGAGGGKLEIILLKIKIMPRETIDATPEALDPKEKEYRDFLREIGNGLMDARTFAQKKLEKRFDMTAAANLTYELMETRQVDLWVDKAVREFPVTEK